MLHFAHFSLDSERSVLSAHGQPIALPPKVFDTLSLLVEDAGNVVSKAGLMDRLWPHAFVEEANLTQNIYVLRRMFARYGITDAIETVPRRGYRFALRVRSDAFASRTRNRFGMRGIAAAAALCIVAAAGAFTAVPRHDSNRLDAHDQQIYALGRYYWSLRTVPALHRSVAYFQLVVRNAPSSALGFAGLSDAYLGLYDYECDGKPCPGYAALSSAYARKAVSIDGNSAAAHASLGMTLRVFGHADGRSDAEFRRAIALDPRYAPAHEWFGNSLLARGFIEPARRELETAVILDPVAPATYGWLARAEYYAHHYRQAIAYAREALALNPARTETRLVLGLASEQVGDRTGALAAFRKLDDAGALIAGLDARAGLRREAEALIARARAGDVNIAIDLVELHHYARALAYFRHVSFNGELDRAFIAMDPRLDAVRGDPRFRKFAPQVAQHVSV